MTMRNPFLEDPTMVLWKQALWMVAIAVGLAPWALRADDLQAAKPADQVQPAADVKAASADDIAKLVEELDAKRFAARQAAGEKLAAIGKPAIDALAKAAVGESMERTVRAIDLLRKFLDSSDEPTKQAAKAALETIAKSDRPAAARRADDALKAKQDEERTFPNAGGVLQGNIVIGGAGVTRMSSKMVNGVKEVEVQENDRKIKIEDDPQKGIKVEVTTKKEGKDVTEKYEAKDAKELEKKHPEGYKVYKQYGQNQAMGAIQVQMNVVAGGGGLQLLPGPNALPVADQARQQVTLTTLRLKSLNRQLETLAKGDQLQKAPQQSKDELKQEIETAKQQLAELEKRLAEKPEPAKKPEKDTTP
jgi:hypothetical protein